LSALDDSLPQDTSPLEGATLAVTAPEPGSPTRQTLEPAPLPGFNLGFLEDQWDDDQASRHIGVEIRLLELDHAVFSLKITEHLVNGHGIVHGGYIFTLADTTFAYACNSRGLTTVAAGVDITFVQAAYLGDVLVADARVRANWGRSGITDVQVTRESDGALVAEFRGRSRQIPPKATPTALA
jgi:acyl-CoA thioesterase